jgi:hypothetical protein
MSGSNVPTAAVLGLLLLTAAAAPAVAATDTSVRLVGADQPTAVGETTTVPVVVETAEGGVGAYNLTVSVDDPTVATVVDADVAGDPGARDVEVAPDGSNASIRAALMDTDDEGAVTVATVTVAGEAAGSTYVDVSVETLGDEEGRAYAVTAEEGSSVAVTDDAGSTDQSNDDAPGDDTDSDTSGSDAGSESNSDASDDDPAGDNTDSDTGSEPNTDSDADTSTKSGSSSDTAATESESTPADSSTGSESDADAGDEDRETVVERSGFGSLLTPVTVAFALIAGVALIGGVAYLRRLR